MRSSRSLGQLDAAFDGTQLVGDPGLLLPATFAPHLGLKQLVERFLNLGDRPGQVNRGDKLSSCRRSAGDCMTRTPCARAARGEWSASG